MFKPIPWRRYRSGIVLVAVALMLASIAILVPAGAQQTTTGTVADSGREAHLEGETLPDVIGEGSASIANDSAQIAPQQLDGREIPVNITVTGFVRPSEYIYVGDTIGLNGTWAAQDLDASLHPGDYFYIPVDSPLKIVEDGPQPLAGPAGAVWGQCTTEADQSRYRCEFGNDFEADTYGASGTWGGNADAIEEFDGLYGERRLVIRAPHGATYGIDKTRVLGYDRNLTPWMGEAAAGTMINYTAILTSSDFSTITEDIVLRDSFDSKLTLCAEDNITITQLGPLAFETAIDGNEIVFTIKRPANGFHLTLPLSINYFLCTTSGGMDPKGTVYDNRIEGTLETVLGDAFVFDEVSVEQWRETWFNAEGVDNGSFELFKVVDEDALPEGYTLADEPFTVQVQEITPDGDIETTYPVTVDANDDSPVRGHNARPEGWTIRLSEIEFPNTSPGYDWGTPVFSGDGVTTGVDEAGNPFALITTNTDSNVAVSLENFISSDDPETGISFPLPDTGDGLAMWVLFGVTGAGLVGVAVYMVRNNRSRKLSEEDDS